MLWPLPALRPYTVLSQNRMALQFSSLEPDVLCRLVYVKDIEFTNQEDDSAQQAPPGTTPQAILCFVSDRSLWHAVAFYT